MREHLLAPNVLSIGGTQRKNEEIMLETYLIRHCSPTLARLKTAGLFTYICGNFSELEEQLYRLNRFLTEKGITVTILQYKENTALIYVYRKFFLEQDLSALETKEILSCYGYQTSDPTKAVTQLKKRISGSEEFPHEIGLFLGYPPGDVMSFIENAGKNYKYCGHWKVYSNEQEARKLFSQFRNCKEAYQKWFHQGRSVVQLTLAS